MLSASSQTFQLTLLYSAQPLKLLFQSGSLIKHHLSILVCSLLLHSFVVGDFYPAGGDLFVAGVVFLGGG